MARKSRKHQHAEMIKPSAADAVGYVRLSVANREESNSIQNQKFIIECWGDQHQIPISHYYINNGFSGKRFDCPAFQKSAYEKQYQVFCKLLKASCKEIALSEIMDCINKILIDTGKQIMVK